MEEKTPRLIENRLFLGVIGAVWFAAIAHLIDAGNKSDSAVRDLWLYVSCAWLSSFFGGFFAMLGPLRVGRAFFAALGFAFVTSGLIYMASLRFEAEGFFNSAHAAIAVVLGFLINFIGWSFVIAIGRRRDVWDYDFLHETAWVITIRAAIAFGFALVFMLLIRLINGLLMSVDLNFLDQFLKNYPAEGERWPPSINYSVFAGLGFGLAAAISWEMQRTLAVLRFGALALLRTMIPFVLIALLIFVPFAYLRSMDQIDFYSPTGLMFAVLMIVITTLASVVEDRPQSEKLAKMLNLSALVMLAIAVLALPMMLNGIWVRVGEYGLTPSRVYALVIALIITGYFGLYLLIALWQRIGWQKAIQRGNIIAALSIVFIAAFLMTPLLNPLRISAASQLERIMGDFKLVKAENLNALYNMGKAGETALQSIEGRGDELVNNFIDRIRQGEYWATIDEADPQSRSDNVRDNYTILPREYAEDDRIDEVNEMLNQRSLRYDKTCEGRTENGNPICAIVIDEYFQIFDQEAVAGIFQCTQITQGVCLRHSLNLIRREGADGYNIGYVDVSAAIIAGFNTSSPTISRTFFDSIAESGYRIEPYTIERMIVE